MNSRIPGWLCKSVLVRSRCGSGDCECRNWEGRTSVASIVDPALIVKLGQECRYSRRGFWFSSSSERHLASAVTPLWFQGMQDSRGSFLPPARRCRSLTGQSLPTSLLLPEFSCFCDDLDEPIGEAVEKTTIGSLGKRPAEHFQDVLSNK